MKKLTAVILTLTLSLTLLCSCNSEKPQETPNNSTANIAQTAVLTSYDKVISLYEKMVHGENCEEYTNENDKEIVRALSHATNNSAGILGYAIKDINADGRDELLLTDHAFRIYALLTSTEQGIASLDNYHHMNKTLAIGADGRLYTASYGKGESRANLIQEISASGTLVDIMAFGCSDENIDDEQVEYFKTVNGEKTAISREEYDGLSAQYGEYFAISANAALGLEYIQVESGHVGGGK